MSLDDLKARQEEAKASAPTVREAMDALQRREDILIPGARSRTPKAQMLDASEVAAKHPDKYLRWVNIRDPQKAESRKMDGYERLTSEEGGKQLGDDLVLMAQPRALYDQRQADLKRQTAERLVAHKTDLQSTAEAVARELRDRHGVNVTAEQLLKD